MVSFCSQFTIGPNNAQVAAFGLTNMPYHYFHLNSATSIAQLTTLIGTIANPFQNNTEIEPDLNV